MAGDDPDAVVVVVSEAPAELSPSGVSVAKASFPEFEVAASPVAAGVTAVAEIDRPGSSPSLPPPRASPSETRAAEATVPGRGVAVVAEVVALVGKTAAPVAVGLAAVAVAEEGLAISSSSADGDADVAGRCKIAMTATAPENSCSAVTFLRADDPQGFGKSDKHSFCCGRNERVTNVESRASIARYWSRPRGHHKKQALGRTASWCALTTCLSYSAHPEMVSSYLKPWC